MLKAIIPARYMCRMETNGVNLMILTVLNLRKTLNYGLAYLIAASFDLLFFRDNVLLNTIGPFMVTNCAVCNFSREMCRKCNFT